MAVQVKIKKLHPDAVIPHFATPGSACVDVVATKVNYLDDNRVVVYLGFALEIPVGYKVCLAPRSSFTQKGWIMQNSPAQIDSDYRGELMLRFEAIPQQITIMSMDEIENARDMMVGSLEDPEEIMNLGSEEELYNFSDEDEDDDPIDEYVGIIDYKEFPYKEGDRCAQMWIEKVQRIEFVEVDELSDTERGEGGFGSTGK